MAVKLKCECGNCNTCKWREDARKWRRKHPAVEKSRTARYRERYPEKYKKLIRINNERKKKERRENPEKLEQSRASSREWRSNNVYRVRWLSIRRSSLRALVCKYCNHIEGLARSPEHLEKVAAAIRSFQKRSK